MRMTNNANIPPNKNENDRSQKWRKPNTRRKELYAKELQLQEAAANANAEIIHKNEIRTHAQTCCDV